MPSGQWSIVDNRQEAAEATEHRWRMVTLRNGAGRLSAGLHCLHCGRVEPVSDRSIRSHGQRLDRSY